MSATNKSFTNDTTHEQLFSCGAICIVANHPGGQTQFDRIWDAIKAAFRAWKNGTRTSEMHEAKPAEALYSTPVKAAA